ncbi:MAG: alkanesulfonate monooxygenase SsuD [Candidatus Aldehydirespiratoraceae bacterium]|jgi:alkanesulfonate monooxygenase SsuD/methylene tetrahydromethanopterin reductase-like flavin-dependent oxidoreductase (luciferase family)
MSIQLGVHVGQQNASMADLVTLWTRLDHAVDWISVWDHLYEAPPAGGTTPHFEAVAILGALASVTSKARLGCLMFCVPYRNPALLAKSIIAIDHISEGRFEPGFGAGWHAPEFRAHGYVFEEVGVRFDQLTEGLEIISGMLGPDDTTTIDGEHFSVRDVTCVPGPFDQAIPLWTGGRGPTRTPATAARFCSGWNVPYVGPTEYRRLNDRLDAACEAIERDPATLERSVNLAFHVGATPAAAEAQLQKIRDQWGPEMAERVTEGALTGIPDQVVEQIAAFHEAGADMVNIALRFPFDTDALDAYLDVVVPAVRRQLN